MCKPRNKWLYELKDGNEIVQYGLTNDPDRRAIEPILARDSRISMLSVLQ